MFAVNVRIDTRDVMRATGGLEDALDGASLSVYLQTFVEPHLRQRASARFASEGDNAVGKWAGLADSTQRIREAMGYGPDHPINRRTGELEQFITGGDNIHGFTPNSAFMQMPGRASGELHEKLVTAQLGREDTGDPDHPKTVARRVMALDPADMIFMLASLNGYLQSAAKGGAPL